MNTLDIDRLNTEVIPRDDDFNSQLTVRERFQRESVEPSDNAAVALEMVSEAAAAIRHLEEQSAEAVARARDLRQFDRQKIAEHRGESRARRNGATRVRSGSAGVVSGAGKNPRRSRYRSATACGQGRTFGRDRRARPLDRSRGKRRPTASVGIACRDRKNYGGDPNATSSSRRFSRVNMHARPSCRANAIFRVAPENLQGGGARGSGRVCAPSCSLPHGKEARDFASTAAEFQAPFLRIPQRQGCASAEFRAASKIGL